MGLKFTKNQALAIFFTQAQLNAGSLDTRYYTETEIDLLLAAYNTGNFYTETELDSGALDSRYFTETEITSNYYNKTYIDNLPSGGSTTLAGLTGDVDIPSPNSGEFLKYDGSNWISAGVPGGISTLAALDDTDITTPSDGYYLRWNGSDWIDEDPELRFSLTGHLHTGIYDPAGTAAALTHDGFADFVANEHIDWTTDQGITNIHAGNIPDLSGTYEAAGAAAALTHDGFADYVANEHLDWTSDLGATNLHANNIPDLSGTYSITGHLHTGVYDPAGTAAALTHDGFADFVANEHIDWTADQGATNLHANNIPDLSGTYDVAGAASTAVGTHESTYSHANYNTAYGWGDHAGLYYTQTQLDTGQLNALYYTESEVDALLTGYSITSHTHDDRYYTETELNTGQLDTRYYTETEIDNRELDDISDVVAPTPNSGEFLKFDGTNWVNAGVPGGISTLSALDDTSVSTPADGEYLRWNGADWANEDPETRFSTTGHVHTGIYDPAGTAAALTHDGFTDFVANEHLDWTSDLGATNLHANNIPDLSGTYSVTGHLHTGIYDPAGTAAALTHDGFVDFIANEHLDWTIDQGATNIHAGNIPDLSGTYDPAGTASTAVGNHESTYNHTNFATAYGWGDHAGLYYTQTQLNTGQLNALYYTESEIDSLLTGYSVTSHAHNDQYYTETEVNALLDAKSNTGHFHAASDITSGTFDDARISQTSVTQHVAAIDHDALSNFVANEHLDWTQDLGATNIHTGNIPDLSGTYEAAGAAAALTHDGFADFVANEHLDWTSDLGATNLHANNIPDLSGTYSTTGHLHAGIYDPAGTAAALTHDGFADFVANEHIDWTTDQGATDIHSGNIPDLSGTYELTGAAAALTHDGFADFVANEHIDWTADQGATNIHSGNIPDLSGTYQPLDADLTALAGISGQNGDIIIYNSAWTRLAKGAEGTVLTAGATLPAWAAADSLSAGDATGDLLYWTGSAWDNLTLGTEGQKLGASSSNIPEWQNEEKAFVFTYAGALDTGDNLPWIPVKFTKTHEVISTYAVIKVPATGEVEVEIEKCAQTNIDGTPSWLSLYTTTLTIDAGERSSNTAATPAVLNATTKILSPGNHLRMRVVDDGTDGADLTVFLTCKEV